MKLWAPGQPSSGLGFVSLILPKKNAEVFQPLELLAMQLILVR